MRKYRSILASIFCAVFAVFVIGCSSPTAVKPTYTPEKIAAIQGYTNELRAMSDRLPELQNLIQQEDFIFVRNFIHGPLGEIRVKLSQATRDLLPNDQKQARELSKQIANDLVDIDQASASNDYKAAIRSYGETIRDLNAFFDILPKG